MKLLNIKMLMIFLILMSAVGFIIRCTHKNDPIPASLKDLKKKWNRYRGCAFSH